MITVKPTFFLQGTGWQEQQPTSCPGMVGCDTMNAAFTLGIRHIQLYMFKYPLEGIETYTTATQAKTDQTQLTQ